LIFGQPAVDILIFGSPLLAVRHRKDARSAMSQCYGALPCWIMPSWRVAEQLPAELGSFDLVIMDEASQSDIKEVTALLRGKKDFGCGRR
jgi:hypothetical protein